MNYGCVVDYEIAVLRDFEAMEIKIEADAHYTLTLRNGSVPPSYPEAAFTGSTEDVDVIVLACAVPY